MVSAVCFRSLQYIKCGAQVTNDHHDFVPIAVLKLLVL